jgi:hypothetical protein
VPWPGKRSIDWGCGRRSRERDDYPGRLKISTQVIDMRNVEPGFRVVGFDGVDVGTVASCTRDYCQVNTGILGLGSPLYVPMDAIRQTEGNTVYLDIPSDRIPEQGWDRPPAGAVEGCATGYYGTLPGGEPTGASASTAGVHPTQTSVAELSPAALQSAQRGWPIICSEGREVGRVASVRPDGLVMERGWLFIRYRSIVPAQAIRQIDAVGHRVYLSVDCAAVRRFHSV